MSTASRVCVLALVELAVGCIGEVRPAPTRATVSVTPRAPTVVVGGTVTFTATVADAPDASVTWSVPGTSCGTISASGEYRAPSTPGTCTVVATSVADGSKSALVTVTVTATPPPSVTIAPSPAATSSCLGVTFTATVVNAANPSVTWTVLEGAAGGSITSAGAYTAPPDAGTYHVVATSVADPSRSATSVVTVTDRIISVTVSPVTTTVTTGGTAQFTTTVTTTCGAYTSSALVGAADPGAAR